MVLYRLVIIFGLVAILGVQASSAIFLLAERPQPDPNSWVQSRNRLYRFFPEWEGFLGDIRRAEFDMLDFNTTVKFEPLFSRNYFAANSYAEINDSLYDSEIRIDSVTNALARFSKTWWLNIRAEGRADGDRWFYVTEPKAVRLKYTITRTIRGTTGSGSEECNFAFSIAPSMGPYWGDRFPIRQGVRRISRQRDFTISTGLHRLQTSLNSIAHVPSNSLGSANAGCRSSITLAVLN